MNEQEALEWLAELFEEPIAHITPETLRKDIKVWDSLGMLTLMAALDEQFGIVLTEDEIAGFKKVADVLDCLKNYGKLN